MYPDHQKALEAENFLLTIALIVAICVIIGILLFSPTAKGAQKEPDPKVYLRVEEATNQGIVATPLISPHFDMAKESEEVPAVKSLLNCTVKNGVHVYADHNEKYLLFECVDTKQAQFTFTLTGLAFDKEQN